MKLEAHSKEVESCNWKIVADCRCGPVLSL